jgi:hypothetical protein
METIKIQQSQSKTALWTGRVISWLCILFLLMDSIMKVIRESHAVDGTHELGFSDSIVQPLGILLLVFTIAYIIPRTAILGAIFLTAYLGGATSIMVHEKQSFIFPIIFCMMVWGGLFLRDGRLRIIVSPQQ